MRTKLYWCKLNKCFVEIGWRDNGEPICWGKNGVGNICEELQDNYVSLPLEPVLWHLYGLPQRIVNIFRWVWEGVKRCLYLEYGIDIDREVKDE